ncbi:hypothetical protein VK90_19385 [Bacillus sp. LK2]|nr:hypothetical protein VK90_19385 [Bacillus sp. LK2]
MIIQQVKNGLNSKEYAIIRDLDLIRNYGKGEKVIRLLAENKSDGSISASHLYFWKHYSANKKVREANSLTFLY